jgi:predicted nucleic acid-binding protein
LILLRAAIRLPKKFQVRSSAGVSGAGWRGKFLSLISVLDFAAAGASEAGKVRSRLERLVQAVGAFETLIAGQAKARSVILASNNVRESSRIPELTVEDRLVPA